MEILVIEYGINSFKYFMVYKNVIMVIDDILVLSFICCMELGVIVIVYVENGEFVYYF